ncbi:MAG TPA: homoserine kinase [Frankiaceae bacterium]|nr:homoserine kinase [Frankiaceae bacterium]
MSRPETPGAAAARIPPAEGLSVRVPATSANLGPGFDTLGLALALYDELDLELTAGGLEVTPYGDVPVDERNLVVRALRTAFAATGAQPAGLRLTYTSRIPHARGLGSSSAAICAGVVAALALRGVAADDPFALELAAGIEGHPDNVAPCLLGGLTVAYYEGRVARAVRLEPAAAVTPVVFVPPVRTSTEQSRAALPDVVPHADAAFSAGRAALLVAALTSRPDRLLEGTEDRLHQAFRLSAVPVTLRLLRALREAGIAAVLSGSGPSVLALCRSADEADEAVAVVAGVPPEAGGLQVYRPAVDRSGSVLLASRHAPPG